MAAVAWSAFDGSGFVVEGEVVGVGVGAAWSVAPGFLFSEFAGGVFPGPLVLGSVLVAGALVGLLATPAAAAGVAGEFAAADAGKAEAGTLGTGHEKND